MKLYIGKMLLNSMSTEDLRRHGQDVVLHGCLQSLENKRNRNGNICNGVV